MLALCISHFACPISHFLADALGHRVSVSGDRADPATFTYDALGNILTSTDGRGNTTTFTYDSLGQLKTSTLPTVAGSPPATTSLTYDAAGHVVSQQDGGGRTVGSAFDALGRLTARSIPVQGALPLGWVTQSAFVAEALTYNTFGEKVSISAPAVAVAAGAAPDANLATTEYDAHGRAVRLTAATGPGQTLQSVTTYSLVGQPLSTTTTATDLAAPQTTTWQYDAANPTLVRSVADPTGLQVAYVFDAVNRRVSATRSTGATESWEYDGLSRVDKHVLTASDSAPQVTGFLYNRFDQLVQTTLPGHTSAEPRIETRTYDAKGRLATQTGSATYALAYDYDESDNLVWMRDANGSETTWTYDARNRLSEKRYADGKTWQFAYDASGNRTSRRDALGRTTTTTYNAFGQPTRIAYANDSAVDFVSNGAGQLTGMSDATGQTTWGRDAWGRVKSQVRAGRTLTTTYNARGQRASLSIAGADLPSRTISYAYDASARLSTLADSAVSGPFLYTYQTGTRWVKEVGTPAGSTITNTRDMLARVIATDYRGSAGQVLNGFAYTYDAAGQRVSEQGPRGNVAFDYNPRGELTGATGFSSGDFSYAYDGIGNRSTATGPGFSTAYTSNNLNQYTKILEGSAPSEPTYEANGNLTSDGNGAQFTYNDEDRLVGIQSTINNKQSVFAYDGLGRRVETRELDGGNLTKTIRYIYDGLVPVEEIEWAGAATGGATATREITRGQDLSGSLDGAGGIGGLLAFTTGGTSHYFFTDANGNVANLFTATNAASASYTYDPFGRRLSATGPLATTNAYQWSSKEYHEPSGLVHYLYRFYNPQLGQWLSRDPLGEEGGVNLYGFVSNDPVGLLDPWGLTLRDWFVEGMVDASMSGNSGAYWGYAGAYTAWDMLSFGALGRREKLERALEAGEISAMDFAAGQLANGTASLAQVALFASTAGGSSGGSLMLQGAKLGFATEALTLYGEQGSLIAAGLPPDISPCEAVQKLGFSTALGGILGQAITVGSRLINQIRAAKTSLASSSLRGGKSFDNWGGEFINDAPASVAKMPLTANPYAGVREASAYLKSQGASRAQRVEWLQSFKAETIGVRAAGNSEYGLRYFDNIKAFPQGRFLFESFPASRQSTALLPKWNQMSGLAQWQIRPGATIIEGQAASQGLGLEGGQLQKFMLNPGKDLLAP